MRFLLLSESQDEFMQLFPERAEVERGQFSTREIESAILTRKGGAPCLEASQGAVWR